MPGNPKIVVLSEQLRGQSFELTAEQYTLGRSEDCAICIPDPTISGQHLTLFRQEDGCYRVLDHNSTNGTRVNGVRIQEQSLMNSDILQAGGIEMLFDSEDKSVTSMLSTQTGIRLSDSSSDVPISGVQNLSPFASESGLTEPDKPATKVALIAVLGLLITAVLVVLVMLLSRLL